MTNMTDIDATKLTASTEAAKPSPLFWGKSGEWWDGTLLLSLAAAALVAGVVFAATGGSFIAHKREAEASNRELDQYKSETERKVSDARQEGIAAGKTAGNALVRAAELEQETAHAKERIAELEKDAAQLSADAEASKAEIAKANARAAEAQLALERYKAPRSIRSDALPAMMIALKPFAGTKVVIFAFDGVEPTDLAGDISHALGLASIDAPTWRWNVNLSVTGVVVAPVPGASSEITNEAQTIVAALRQAHIDASLIGWPGGDWKQFGVLIGQTFDQQHIDVPIRIIVGAKPQ